jgi:hypothetical protein
MEHKVQPMAPYTSKVTKLKRAWYYAECVTYVNNLREVIVIFDHFEVSVIFEAAGVVSKIRWNLKPGQHNQGCLV